jgi:hypothetical protein
MATLLQDVPCEVWMLTVLRSRHIAVQDLPNLGAVCKEWNAVLSSLSRYTSPLVHEYIDGLIPTEYALHSVGIPLDDDCNWESAPEQQQHQDGCWGSGSLPCPRVSLQLFDAEPVIDIKNYMRLLQAIDQDDEDGDLPFDDPAAIIKSNVRLSPACNSALKLVVVLANYAAAHCRTPLFAIFVARCILDLLDQLAPQISQREFLVSVVDRACYIADTCKAYLEPRPNDAVMHATQVLLDQNARVRKHIEQAIRVLDIMDSI